MQSILDPVKLWIGQPPLALSATDKRPVALSDAVTISKDTGPVSIAVLANDFDPEGGPVSLVSAFAALGTAVAEPDGTVSYTPPPGFTGPDTITYEIADDLDQRRTGQVNVTVAEPQLSIDATISGTLVITAETGLIDITVTEPADLAGSYQANVADLAGGPVNLVPPRVSGSLVAGAEVTASDGLWIHDAGAAPVTQSWQWRRDGVDIAAATGAAYTLVAGDETQVITVAETLSDAFGQRIAESVPSATFLPSDDAALIGWWDGDDAGTVTESAGAVSAWSDKAGGPAMAQVQTARQPVYGTRTLNGRAVLDFPGNHSLDAALALPAGGDVAFHMVLVIDAIDNAFDAILSLDAVGEDFQIDANDAAAFAGRLNATGGTADLTGGPFAGAILISATFDRTGAGQAEVHVNDVLRGSAAYIAALDSAATLGVMTNRAGNAYATGAVAELIVTGDVGARAAYHAYLATKWGLT